MQIMAHNAAEAVVGQIVKRDPAMVRLEQRRPQFPARLAGAIAPYFALWMSRVKLQRRGEGAAIMAHHLLPAQAQRAADFYGSPLGQRMMRVMAGNLTMDSLLQSKLEPGTITRAEGQDRDIKRAMIKTLPDFIATLSPAERRQIAQLGKDPLFAKVNAASAELMRQPDPEFSKFGTPAEMAAIKTAIDQVVTEELAAS